MLEDSLRNLKEQFASEPKIENQDKIHANGQVILCGMGGSRLASGFLKMLRPDLNLRIHNDYGLPHGYQGDSFVIVNSYSGNTEEAIGNFHAARTEGLLTAVVTCGGELLELAKKDGMPYVVLPQGHEPRIAVGFMLRALLALIGDLENKNGMGKLVEFFYPDQFEAQGKALAEALQAKGPIIYASNANKYLAEHWKIAFNENTKTPAEWNVLPELAHNELAALNPSMPVLFIFLRDPDDHPRIQIKFGALETILKQKGFEVANVPLPNSNPLLKIFTSYALANWVSLHLAKLRGVSPDDTNSIEEFKKAIK
jgi:glucose/mannose-6-phosphate isomerase